MPTFTVYSLGDTASYWSMLNGVAMFFSQTSFWASAALTGSLLLLVQVLIHMLAKAGGGSGGQSPVLGPLYLGATFILLSVNTSVVVEDIYTGSVVQVDNIPLIVALPSSISTTGAYKVFKLADQAFQSVDGSYMSVSANGMVSPLKLLMSLRKGFEKSSPSLAMSIKTFAMDCTTNSGFKPNEYKDAPNSLQYLLSSYNPTNLTMNYPAGSSTPTATNCGAQKTVLATRVAKYLAGDPTGEGSPDKVVAGNMGSNLKQGKTPQTYADAGVAVQNIVSDNLAGAGKDAQNTMQNMIFYDVINMGMDCAGVSATPSDANACWTQAAVVRQGLEQWKSNSAGAGTLFTKIMAPAITFMQLMFYGFSPLVLLTCLFLGEKSLAMFGKYLIFGVWTVSWLPFSCVIQMYIQNQMAASVKAMAVNAANGIVPANMSDFYDMTSTNLALASDLLAATPMISFALLTGSTMAMTGLAKRWSAETHFDEKSVSPDAQKVGAVHAQEGLVSSNSVSSVRSGTSGFIPTLDRTQSGSDVIQSSSATAIADSSALSRTASKLSSALESDSTATAHQKMAGVNLSNAVAEQKSATDKFDKSIKESTSLSNDQKSALQAGASGGIDIGFIKASAAFQGTTAGSKKAAEEFMNSSGTSYSAAATASKNLQTVVGDTISATVSKTHTTSQAESDAAAKALGHTKTSSQNFSRAASSTNQGSVKTSIGAGEFGGIVEQDPVKKELAKTILAGLLPQQRDDIAHRANEFIRTTNMPPENAPFAALGESLLNQSSRGGEGAAAAGGNFDLLNSTHGASLSGGSHANENQVDSQALKADVATGTGTTFKPQNGIVAGAGGNNHTVEKQALNSITSGGASLSPAQVSGSGAAIAKATAGTGMGGASAAAAEAGNKVEYVSEDIQLGQQNVEKRSATEALRGAGTQKQRLDHNSDGTHVSAALVTQQSKDPNEDRSQWEAK